MIENVSETFYLLKDFKKSCQMIPRGNKIIEILRLKIFQFV